MGRAWALVVLSLIEFRVFVLLHRENLYELAVAAHDVTVGTPQWRAFQSRLLGPELVAALSWITGRPYDAVHGVVLLALTIAANLTAYAVFKRLTASADVAFRYTVYFLFAFLVLVADDWAFVWDFADMPIFLLFAYGAFTGRTWRYFVPLFLVGLVNRESALAIPAWLVLDALVNGREAKRAQLWIGAAMGVAGVAYTALVRQALFVRSSLESTDGFVELPWIGNQFNVVESLRRAAIHLRNPHLDMVFLVHVGYVWFAWYFWSHRRAVRERYLAQFVLVTAMLLAVPTFGFFDETRQYAYLVPFLLVFDLELRGRAGATSRPRD